MVQIVLNGVFAEDFKETNQRQVFRSFCRTFSIVPIGSGWSIVSDMLFVTVVNDELLKVSELVF
jgi:nuclear RNA export factor